MQPASPPAKPAGEPPAIVLTPEIAARLEAAPPVAPSQKSVHECWFCSSDDTMVPFARRPEVFLLTRIFPRLRWHYCRACTRHFITLMAGPGKPRRQA